MPISVCLGLCSRLASLGIQADGAATMGTCGQLAWPRETEQWFEPRLLKLPYLEVADIISAHMSQAEAWIHSTVRKQKRTVLLYVWLENRNVG